MCGFFVFDAFGTFTGIRYSGHHRVRSSMGGIMTIFSAIATLVTIAVFGNIYISGSEVSQVYSQEKYWNSQNFTVDETFVFAAANRYNLQVNNRQDIFEMVVDYRVFNAQNFTTLSTVVLENKPCNIQDWKRAEDQYNVLGLANANCYSLPNAEISGNVNTELLKYFRVRYILQLGDEEQNAMLQNVLLRQFPTANVYFIETIYNLDGKKAKPYYYINSVQVNLNYDNQKTTNIYLSQDNFVINNDYIFTTTKDIYESYAISSWTERSQLRPATDTATLTINLMSSTNQTVIKYSFMTFSEMLARIGGIVQNLVTVFFVLNYVKNYWSYELNQFNDLYNKIENDMGIKGSLQPVHKRFMQIMTSTNVSKFKAKNNNGNSPIAKDSMFRVVNPGNSNEKQFNSSGSDKDNSNNNNYQYIGNNINNNTDNNVVNSSNFFNVSNLNNNADSNNLISINNREGGLSILRRNENNLNMSPIDNRNSNNNLFNNNNKNNEVAMNSDNEDNNNKFAVDMNKLNNKDQELKEQNVSSLNNNNKKINTQINSPLQNTKLLNNNTTQQDRNNTTKQQLKLLKAINTINQPLKIKSSPEKEEFYNEAILFKRKNQNQKFEISLFEYVINKYFDFLINKNNCCNMCFSSARSKHKTFAYVDDYLSSSLEMKNYQKQFFQINMLKFLMLNDEQLRAFEQIPLYNGFSIIKKQEEYFKSMNLDYNFGCDNTSLENLDEVDKKLHSVYIGMN